MVNKKEKQRIKELELKALKNMAWDDVEKFLNEKDRKEYLNLLEKV